MAPLTYYLSRLLLRRRRRPVNSTEFRRGNSTKAHDELFLIRVATMFPLKYVSIVLEFLNSWLLGSIQFPKFKISPCRSQRSSLRFKVHFDSGTCFLGGGGGQVLIVRVLQTH